MRSYQTLNIFKKNEICNIDSHLCVKVRSPKCFSCFEDYIWDIEYLFACRLQWLFDLYKIYSVDDRWRSLVRQNKEASYFDQVSTILNEFVKNVFESQFKVIEYITMKYATESRKQTIFCINAWCKKWFIRKLTTNSSFKIWDEKKLESNFSLLFLVIRISI